MRTYRTDHRNPQRLRYGWRLTMSGHIVVEPRQRASIFVMLALRNDEATLQQICDHLSRLQSPTPRKGRWHCSTVKKIIDQNRALMSLLPHALPASAVSTLQPITPATPKTDAAVKPVVAKVPERANGAIREPAYAPSQRHRAGALVHKSDPQTLARG